jgi:CRP-like cAMP-binding protein
MTDLDNDEVALILSGVRILQHLDTDVVEDLARRVRVAQFAPGEAIVEYGQPGLNLYILFRGKAEVLIPDEDGGISRRVDLRKGDVIGEISLLTGDAYGADVIARDEVTALYLDRTQFLALIEQYQPFAESMTELMRERLAQNGGINQVGRYQLLDKLGEGNMALVFSAYDPELDREVAVKMLKYQLAYDPEFLQRFQREALIIASLNHPHIINVYEIINAYSTSFIVMEKLEGQNLWDKLQQQGAFSITQARGILQQVASALQYAHQHGEHGIVHRDVKPSNIVIDAFGNIKLTDFGIAGPPQQRNVTVEGTPSYLAPEVINGETVDGRADIYALGVMAFHMLTNSLPFSASTLDKILAMQLRQAPPDILNYCPDLDDAFVEFIKRALEKDLNKRIADWDEIRKLLTHVVRQDRIPLASNEMGVVIRLRDVPYSDAARIINAMQRMLRDSDIDHSIEMQRGDIEN